MFESKHESIIVEIERKNYTRAADLASSLSLGEKEVIDLRSKALWQMAAINRNAIGTKMLASRYGYSKNEARQILEKYAGKMRKKGSTKALDVCYDPSTGKYIFFEEWLDQYLKKWDKM